MLGCMLLLLAIEIHEAHQKIEEAMDRVVQAIQEANMTYEEYCEYHPEECEELF